MTDRISLNGQEPPETAATHAFLSAGFRPFFLFAGLSAVLPLLAWILAFLDYGATPGNFAPAHWHGHEMIFGFIIAAATGFLLTAVPNWTHSPPFSGWQLGLLALIWFCGRLAMWFGAPAGPLVVAALDLAMIPVLGIYIGRRLVAYAMRRNYVVLGILFILMIANALMHLEAVQVFTDTAGFGLKLGIYAVVLLITLISGRVIPGFTANALRRRGIEVDTQTPAWITGLVIASMILAILADLFATPGAGILAGLAALMLLLRMFRWKTLQVLGDPMVWVLHAGHLWLAIGFALLAAAGFSDEIEPDAGLHALSAGAMGTMVLGMMTRVALGHTGRELKVHPAIIMAYGMVIFAALLRVLAALTQGDSFSAVVGVAGLLWAGGYAIFLVVYWPILTRPRI